MRIRSFVSAAALAAVSSTAMAQSTPRPDQAAFGSGRGGADEEDDDLTEEAKANIRKQMLQRARQPNLSFFAFTATPKFKTKAVFDEPGPSGA